MNRVCLINPPTSRDKQCVFFPMGLVMLGTVLKENGVPIEIADFELHHRLNKSTNRDLSTFLSGMLEKLERTQADVFGITSICSNFPLALTMAKEIRTRWPHSKIVMGGPQPSLVAESLLEVFSCVDVVVIGEGENTFLELVQIPWTSGNLKKISGIAYREGEKVVRTPPRGLIGDLDGLPFPDFSLVNLPQYLSLSSVVPLIEAGRGCPFSCSFCSTAPMWERKFRVKSPQRILEEMELVHKNYGRGVFEFIHDNFTTSKKYTHQFCEYFLEHNRKRLIWASSARTDTIVKEDLALLKKAGCGGLFYGVDSGSNKIQKAIDKDLDLEAFKEILQETISRDMRAHVSLILGFPLETREDLNQTLDLGIWAKTTHPHLVYVSFHRLSPLAGSPLFVEHKNRICREKKNTSDISPLLFNAQALWDLIENYPGLFSSFYSIPTPFLEGIDLSHLARHYSELAQHCAASFSWLIKKRGTTPLQIYEQWQKNHADEDPSGCSDYLPILESFCDYL